MILFKYVKSLSKWVWKDKIRFTLTLLSGAALALTLALLFPPFVASLVSLMAPASAFAVLAFIVVAPIMLINAGVFICCRACLRWAGESTQASASENLSLAGKVALYTGLAAAFVGGGFIPVGILGAGALISIGVGAVLAKGVEALVAGGVALFTYIMERRAQANREAAIPSPMPPAPQPVPLAHPGSSHAQALQQIAAASPPASPPLSRSNSASLLLPADPSPHGIPLRPMPPSPPLPPPVATPPPVPLKPAATSLPPPYRHAVAKLNPLSQAGQHRDPAPLMTFPSQPPPVSRPNPYLVPGNAKPPAAPLSFLSTVPEPADPKQASLLGTPAGDPFRSPPPSP